MAKVLDQAVAYWIVAEWSGVGVVPDLSGNGHDLTLINAPVHFPDANPPYIELTAVNLQHLETPNHANLNFGAGGSFTLLVAARYRDAGADNTLISKRGAGGATGYDIRTWTVPEFAFEVRSAVGNHIDVTVGAPARNKVVALAGRRDAGVDIEALIDGSPSGSPTADTSGDITNTDPFRIGQRGADKYSNMDFIGAALFRLLLSDSEVRKAGMELLGVGGPTLVGLLNFTGITSIVA